MRVALDQWLFVYSTYALAIAATLGLVVWAWLTMRAAEKRRDEGRGPEQASTRDGSQKR
jgi:hypothetical protein